MVVLATAALLSKNVPPSLHQAMAVFFLSIKARMCIVYESGESSTTVA